MCGYLITDNPDIYVAIEFRFTILCDDHVLDERLRSIFFHCRDTSSNAATHLDGSLEVSVHSESATIEVGDYREDVSFDAILRTAVSLINGLASRHRPDGMAICHAGAVGMVDRVLLLPGKSGSGKSTVVASLIEAGASYLSDELVAVASSGLLAGYPKAITLKHGSWVALQASRPKDPHEGSFVSDVDFVRPEYFGKGATVGSGTSDLVVFPTYSANSESTLRHLSSPEALVLLLQCAYLPLDRAAFVALAELAASSTSVAFVYNREVNVAERLYELASSPSKSPVVVECTAWAGQDVIGVDCVWAGFDDDLVILNLATNAIVHLDAAGSDQWRRALSGRAMSDALKNDLVALDVLSH